MKNLKSCNNKIAAVMVGLFLLTNVLWAQEKEAVNVTNVARAETDIAIQRMYDLTDRKSVV